ncbi:MAG: 50S ribosomal protein L15 [Candidatus Paceibacterota bacterium]|jgi:large subunit ribosomal protein L15
MQLHQIKRSHPNKKSRLIGRGGKRGTTSGRGTKGQLARAGHKTRPELRDIIKKLPKRRGYKFTSIYKKPFVISLGQIEKNFDSGEKVTPGSLVKKGVIGSFKGKLPEIKILANGDIKKKVSVSGCKVSADAKVLIEKVGGEVK